MFVKKVVLAVIGLLPNWIVSCIPSGSYLARIIRNLRTCRLAEQGDVEMVFTKHYILNAWGSTESVSGYGSTKEYTANMRKALPELLHRLGVKCLLDAPCGDYNWMQLVRWSHPLQYIGGDIVDDLIRKNEARYGGVQKQFIHLNIISDKLPEADLWLCRDCLFHLSNENIFRVFANFLKSDIKYILTSIHYLSSTNEDIETGDFRLLNLKCPPFDFDAPSEMIDDWVDGYPVRSLALWERSSIAESLSRNAAFQRILNTDLPVDLAAAQK
jgi:hypothetical protein